MILSTLTMMLISQTKKNHLLHILVVKFLGHFIPEHVCSKTANKDTFYRQHCLFVLIAGKCVGGNDFPTRVEV